MPRMQLEFFGAAGEVTGSCHILRVAGRQLLLDCGMIQGGATRRRAIGVPFPFDATDHRRRGPEPCAHRSLRPPAAAGQARLSRAYLHEQGLRRPGADPAARFGEPCHARRRARQPRRTPGDERAAPLYDLEDVEAMLRQVEPIAYDTPRELLPGITVRVRDAGHILGSSSVEVWVSEGGR